MGDEPRREYVPEFPLPELTEAQAQVTQTCWTCPYCHRNKPTQQECQRHIDEAHDRLDANLVDIIRGQRIQRPFLTWSCELCYFTKHYNNIVHYLQHFEKYHPTRENLHTTGHQDAYIYYHAPINGLDIYVTEQS